jgi:hypothetical protein
MANTARVITIVAADLTVAFFAWLIMTSDTLDEIDKSIGMLICLIVVSAATTNALKDKGE